VIFLALVMLLCLQAPVTDCHIAVVPLLATRQMAPIDGIPVLVDGAAVSFHCKF
jgi:hypothetical protein